jgi:hypothetical protein
VVMLGWIIQQWEEVYNIPLVILTASCIKV